MRLQPDFQPALGNLEDLDLPPAERAGPWPFLLDDWLSPDEVGDIPIRLLLGDPKTPAQQYSRKHPEFVAIVPHLLDRGGRMGQELALMMASAVWSRYQPQFSQDALKERVQVHDIVYLFLGEELGGRPNDPSCYDEQNRVNYEACMQRPEFQQGIQRLVSAWKQGRRLALLCSESRPQDCHRSKLVGVALAAAGVDVTHLDENGALVPQAEVMSWINGGQPGLFPDMPTGKAARSRGKYRPGGG